VCGGSVLFILRPKINICLIYKWINLIKGSNENAHVLDSMDKCTSNKRMHSKNLHSALLVHIRAIHTVDKTILSHV
jgi:hypothetical protein